MHYHCSFTHVALCTMLAVCILLPCSLCAEEITFRADKMTGAAGKKNETTTLIGNAFECGGQRTVRVTPLPLRSHA